MRICKELTQLNGKKTTELKTIEDMNRHFFKGDVQIVNKQMKRYSASLVIK